MILYRGKLDRAVNILEKIKIKVKKMKNFKLFPKTTTACYNLHPCLV